MANTDKSKNKKPNPEPSLPDDYKDFLRQIFKSQKFNTGYIDVSNIPAEEDYIIPYGQPGYEEQKTRMKDRTQKFSAAEEKALREMGPARDQAFKLLRQLHPSIANIDKAGMMGMYGWGNDILDPVKEEALIRPSKNRLYYERTTEGPGYSYESYNPNDPSYSPSYTGMRDYRSANIVPNYIRGQFDYAALIDEYERGNVPEELFARYIQPLGQSGVAMPLETHNNIRDIVAKLMPAVRVREGLRREITRPEMIGYQVTRPEFVPPDYIDAAVAGY